jgi:benzoate 4-monooxygenase
MVRPPPPRLHHYSLTRCQGGLVIAGRAFTAGTVLSVPSYTIHRDPAVWGADVEAFRPERWFEDDRKDAMQRTFNPFSVGPRACVGRNLASLELQIIVASILRRFHFVLAKPGQKVRFFCVFRPWCWFEGCADADAGW